MCYQLACLCLCVICKYYSIFIHVSEICVYVHTEKTDVNTGAVTQFEFYPYRVCCSAELLLLSVIF